MNISIILLLHFGLFTFFEPLIINTVYLTNIDLFLDLILTKKRRFKLINHILEHYLIVNGEVIYKK